ncbi:MAG: hypothetical protein KDI13_10530 [Alphaproteobacteria bacterium]|nr:hypothetical protein [Alphaproteobacteria bacterium]
MFRTLPLSAAFFFVMALTACSGFSRYPGGGVQAMSDDTLCYRAVYAAADPAISEEVRTRGLDCARVLGAE